MDPFGSKTLNQPKSSLTSPQAKDGGKKSVDKKAAVDEEMKRMNKLPANSAYATHRLRVLNKVLQLLSIQVIQLFLCPCYLNVVSFQFALSSISPTVYLYRLLNQSTTQWIGSSPVKLACKARVRYYSNRLHVMLVNTLSCEGCPEIRSFLVSMA
ncbi:hypothetical protein RHMOL_Rhmol04G0033500 [Rhododendron molle]|uniref:Uncharacterized protein n=3 Tax=Rhododendron molle TaxID=49168 RepID=A0ACC0NWW2_RHOML|nr:hypothetical protein RHMOL_Rhmol04G0033500 [Rhododendron molle]KAI8557745.1 hypothetical protein RHMOL_Rhmol04G0033500 [Rhododendron molle]KAI8557746.1 hypothetical protein RHMOL_Rhmol04G0033500 [Rhododendron molle]